MKKTKLYRYIGRNGSITSPVLLDDIKHLIYFDLLADKDKILTNGEKKVFAIIVPEEEVGLWEEIDNIGQN